MAKMTKDESDTFAKQTGSWVSEKCDKCHTPLVGCLTYMGDNGKYCTRECLNEAEPRGSHTISRERPNMSNENKKKKKKIEEDEDKPKKKSKKADEDEDDEDEKPKKKAKKSDDDEKPKKSSKNPFRQASAMYEAFELAREGTTKKKLVKFCEDKGIGSARIFGVLRREEYGNVTWKYSEDDGNAIQVTIRKKKD